MLRNKLSARVIMLFCLLVFAGCADVVDSVRSNIQTSGDFVRASMAKDKGDSAYNNGNYARAFTSYQTAAELGEKHSQFILANMYMAGEGVQRSPKNYFYWMQQSADNGYPPANYLVGRAYLHSQPSIAVKYFKNAANKEHDSSMYMLGWMYAVGKGVSQSDAEALAWFRRAKAQAFPVEEQLLSRSSLRNYIKQKNIGYIKTKKEKQAQQKLVFEIQQRLTRLGYKPGPIDGLMGGKTRSAIKAFQRKNGIKADGRATDKLLKKLKAFR